MTHRNYTVIMTQGSNKEETEHSSKTAADAISQARRFWNENEGRTKTCELLPRKFKAKLVRNF